MRTKDDMEYQQCQRCGKTKNEEPLGCPGDGSGWKVYHRWKPS